jgi:putative permease
MVAYFVIQALDGNLLVPCSSPRRSTCPVAIIIAVLVFGGLWGFWGVFFAIPSPPWSKRCSTPGPSGKISPPCP